MGYYTRYELKFTPAPKRWVTGKTKTGETVTVCVEESDDGRLIKSDDIFAQLEEICGLDISGVSNMKWYDHEVHMRQLSCQNPEVLFALTGAGEEQPDLWVKYFENGKMQVCKGEVTYPPYNAEELK